jgi:hypothetical protein
MSGPARAEWQRKGATLSDKTARKEFGLTQEQIVKAIRAGKMQFRYNAIHGNPFLRLLRREVEALVTNERGNHYLDNRKATAELARVNKERKLLKTQLAALEERKSRLMEELSPPERSRARVRSGPPRSEAKAT